VQKKRPGEYWIHGGSFIGGGGGRRRATAEEAADYMSQGPTLGGSNETDQGTRLGGCAPLFWNDKIRACSDEVADPTKLGGQLHGLAIRDLLIISSLSVQPPEQESILLTTPAAVQIRKGEMFLHKFASSRTLRVYALPSHQISMVYIRLLRWIDNVALRRRALLTPE
jgi:hypothetical protein